MKEIRTYVLNGKQVQLSTDSILMLNNVFYIPQRLRREIDPGLFVVYDLRSGKYEVHNSDYEDGDTYYCTIPYDELDARALEYVREIRFKDNELKIAEMEAHNEKIINEEKKKAEDEAGWKLREIHEYVAPKSTVDAPDDGAYKTRFV